MADDFDQTPHQLIEEIFPVAKATISPLVEIIRVNPNLATEVIELAIMIGINQAMARIQWDKVDKTLNEIKNSQFPRW